MDRETADGFSVVAIVVAMIAALFGVVAIGLTWRGSNASAQGSPEATVAKPVATVRLSDFRIALDKSPLPAGDVAVKVENKGPSPHNLTIEGLGQTPTLAPGNSSLLQLGRLEAGSYTWFCSISGHREAGMQGTFTVAGDAGATPVTKAASGATTSASDAIDNAHAAVVKQFLSGPPAKTAGLGGVPMTPRIENGVKVFDLTTKVVQWEVAPGKVYEAWTYNGTVPGPEIRVKQGETVKIHVKNDLPQSTSIHYHGVEVNDNRQDGVTFVTQDPIKPGQTYDYTLTPINCGSHMYHSHHAADGQVPLGLLGAFVVDCTTTPVPAFNAHDSEYTEILTDGPLGFGINGKGFPATAPIVAKPGEKTLIRFMNEGLIIHPMHLHGHRMLVVAKDGNFLPAPYEVDTLNVAPGERYDVIVTSLYNGAWAFHCHILTHAESDVGLHGMTTLWIVKP